MDDVFQEEAFDRNNELVKEYGNIPSYGLWMGCDIRKESNKQRYHWWKDHLAKDSNNQLAKYWLNYLKPLIKYNKQNTIEEAKSDNEILKKKNYIEPLNEYCSKRMGSEFTCDI